MKREKAHLKTLLFRSERILTSDTLLYLYLRQK